MKHGWSIRLAGLVPAGLIAACGVVPPAAEYMASPTIATTAQQAAADATIDWSRGDCVSRLRLLQQAASEGRLGPDARPPFAVQLIAAPGDWLDAVPPLPIEADLPLALEGGGEGRCVLQIGPVRDQSAAHRAVDVQDVRSAYQRALRSERNPDYDAAQLEHRQARESARDGQRVVRVGDPLLDLVGTTVGGVIGALDRRVRRQEVEDAAAELAATPRSRDRPVYQPYSFERVVVRAQKEAVVPVALLDAQGRRLRATELRQRERREIFMLRGLDPRDRDYEQHRASSMTRADLARWARTPPALRLSSVAIALTEGAAAAEARLAEIAPAAGSSPPEPADLGLELDLGPDDAALAAEPALESLSTAWDDHPEDDTLDLSVPNPGSPRADPAGLDISESGPGMGWETAAAPDGASGVADPAAASVVAVRAGRAAGHGFYVREDLVLTTARLVGTASVVDITSADGANVPALVAGLDRQLNLALLQVPRPGLAVSLHEGRGAEPPRPPGTSDPGLPVSVNGEVVGMIADTRRVVSAEAIRAFLHRHAALLAAVP